MFDENSFRNLAFGLHEQLLQYTEQGESYRVGVKGSELWELYLDSFTGELRKLHDCSECRKFFHVFGNIAWIQQGKLISLWDAPRIPEEYRPVVKKLSERVHRSRVTGLFRVHDRKPGLVGAPTRSKKESAEFSDEHLHLCGFLFGRFIQGPKEFKLESARIDQKFNAIERLRQFPMSAVQQAACLFNEGVIYHDFRWKEYSETVLGLLCQDRSTDETEFWSWEHLNEFPDGVTGRRGCLVKLLEDLSSGKSLQDSVESYRARLGMGLTRAYENFTLGLSNITWPSRGNRRHFEDIHYRDFVSKVLPVAKDLKMFLGTNEIRRLFLISDSRFCCNPHTYRDRPPEKLEDFWIPEDEKLQGMQLAFRVVTDKCIPLDVSVSGPEGLNQIADVQDLAFDYRDLDFRESHFYDKVREYYSGIAYSSHMKVGKYKITVKLATDQGKKSQTTRSTTATTQEVKFTLFLRFGYELRRAEFSGEMQPGESIDICKLEIETDPEFKQILRMKSVEMSTQGRKITIPTFINGLSRKNLFGMVKVGGILQDTCVYHSCWAQEPDKFILSGLRGTSGRSVGIIWVTGENDIGFFEATIEGKQKLFAVRFVDDFKLDWSQRWYRYGRVRLE